MSIMHLVPTTSTKVFKYFDVSAYRICNHKNICKLTWYLFEFLFDHKLYYDIKYFFQILKIKSRLTTQKKKSKIVVIQIELNFR